MPYCLQLFLPQPTKEESNKVDTFKPAEEDSTGILEKVPGTSLPLDHKKPAWGEPSLGIMDESSKPEEGEGQTRALLVTGSFSA